MGSNVPNLKGLFLRGRGGNAAALGVTQGDAIRNISGTSTVYGLIEPTTNDGIASGAFFFPGRNNSGIQQITRMTNANLSFDASRVVPTANENRPANQAVRHLIKALK